MSRRSLGLGFAFVLLASGAAAQTVFIGFSEPFHPIPESAGTYAIAVTRSGDVSGSATVTWSVSTNNPNANDYGISPNFLVFAPGETTKSINVHVTNDLLSEGDESFSLFLTASIPAAVTTGRAIVVIEDDDGLLALSRPTVVEGAGAAVVTISRHGDALPAKTVFATTSRNVSPATAQEYADYIPVSATFAFAEGERSKSLVIPILDDDVVELQEQFAVLVDGLATTVTIRDNDSVQLSLSDVTVTEGEGQAFVEVTLSQPHTAGISLLAFVTGGSAAVGQDFRQTEFSFFMPAGSRRLRLPFEIIDDALAEGDETFTVRLNSCSFCGGDPSVIVTKWIGTVTIRDNDPAFIAEDTLAGENDGGTTATFHVRLTVALPGTATVDYAVSPATAGDDDFTPSSGTLTFAPGERSKTIAVPVADDALPEDEELFVLRLSNPAGAPIARGQAVARILDDDPHFVATKDLEYAIADGMPLHLDLYVPTTGSGSYPLVIWIPGDDWMTAPRWPTPAFRQAGRGYAVAVVQYRTIESGVFPAPLHDVKAAVRWLRANAERFGLDPSRFAVWGAGAGAHLASLLGTTEGVPALTDLSLGNGAVSSKVQAVIDWAGPTDLTALGRDALPCSTTNYDAIASNLSLLLGCPAVICATEAVKASPAAYVTPDDPPFLIVHGEADCLVSPRQSESFARLLKLRKVDVTLKLLPALGHINGSWETPESFGIVDAFLDAHMKPGPRRRATR